MTVRELAKLLAELPAELQEADCFLEEEGTRFIVENLVVHHLVTRDQVELTGYIAPERRNRTAFERVIPGPDVVK